jgi:hypothetical protein
MELMRIFMMTFLTMNMNEMPFMRMFLSPLRRYGDIAGEMMSQFRQEQVGINIQGG